MIFNKYSIEPLRHQACIFCYMAVQFGYMRMHFWLYTICDLWPDLKAADDATSQTTTEWRPAVFIL